MYTNLIKLSEQDFPTLESYLDKKVLEKELYTKIDPSIRIKTRNRGLSLIQNIYSGYDSEYKAKDAKNNDLLSVQLAVNTKTLLKVPNNKLYSLSALNTLTDDSYELKNIKGLNVLLLE